MSKKCADCGCEVNCNVIQGLYYCPRCDDDKREIDVLPMTLFDRITQSVDTLAEEFVDMMYDRVAGEYRYYSMLTGDFYNSREEAIAATVDRLKGLEDE